jgi:hypothetical protein
MAYPRPERKAHQGEEQRMGLAPHTSPGLSEEVFGGFVIRIFGVAEM